MTSPTKKSSYDARLIRRCLIMLLLAPLLMGKGLNCSRTSSNNSPPQYFDKWVITDDIDPLSLTFGESTPARSFQLQITVEQDPSQAEELKAEVRVHVDLPRVTLKTCDDPCCKTVQVEEEDVETCTCWSLNDALRNEYVEVELPRGGGLGGYSFECDKSFACKIGTEKPCQVLSYQAKFETSLDEGAMNCSEDLARCTATTTITFTATNPDGTDYDKAHVYSESEGWTEIPYDKNSPPEVTLQFDATLHGPRVKGRDNVSDPPPEVSLQIEATEL